MRFYVLSKIFFEAWLFSRVGNFRVLECGGWKAKRECGGGGQWDVMDL